MGKRKTDDSGENQMKKHQKMGAKDSVHRKQNKKFVQKDKSKFVDNKSNKNFKNKRNEKTKKKATAIERKPQSMQEILSEKLRKIQERKSAEKTSKEDGVSSDIPNKDSLSEELSEATTELDSQKASKISKSVDKSNTVSNDVVDNENVTNDDEEDPEKAEIRKKKQEKRKQKKLQKEQVKQENKDRAGTAKMSAIEYLNHWKEKKEGWKFTKVRQVWLLHNMYDMDQLTDEYFPILLSYLEGLKGKSREVTVTEAEQIIEKAEDVENDESSAKMMERARQIIQLLSY